LSFLVYFWYFFGFTFKQIRVFLKGFWLKTIKSKNKKGQLTAWAHRSVHPGGLTELAQLGPAALLTLSPSQSKP
jgi:hypothetical protein